jgi:hypothetical protein
MQKDLLIGFRSAHIGDVLNNRFYLGEVVYRGEVHPGPHAGCW